MYKKYNGFNNGRDKSDGVGGREVNHGTQQTMTKEQILESRISCTCNEAYKTRQMADPDCGRCNWYEEILSSMEEYKEQEVAKEREKAKKMTELLKEYEQWEADLIADNAMWWPSVPKDRISGKTYDTMLILQNKRNELLKKSLTEYEKL